jgi:hypothetical protein
VVVGGMELRSQKRATEEDEWEGKVEVERVLRERRLKEFRLSERKLMCDFFMAAGKHRSSEIFREEVLLVSPIVMCRGKM